MLPRLLLAETAAAPPGVAFGRDDGSQPQWTRTRQRSDEATAARARGAPLVVQVDGTDGGGEGGGGGGMLHPFAAGFVALVRPDARLADEDHPLPTPHHQRRPTAAAVRRRRDAARARRAPWLVTYPVLPEGSGDSAADGDPRSDRVGATAAAAAARPRLVVDRLHVVDWRWARSSASAHSAVADAAARDNDADDCNDASGGGGGGDSDSVAVACARPRGRRQLQGRRRRRPPDDDGGAAPRGEAMPAAWHLPPAAAIRLLNVALAGAAPRSLLTTHSHAAATAGTEAASTAAADAAATTTPRDDSSSSEAGGSAAWPRTLVFVARRAAATRRLAPRVEVALLAAAAAAAARGGLTLDVFADDRTPPPSAEETLSRFGRAAVVVGVHGAGLTNVAFCPSAAAAASASSGSFAAAERGADDARAPATTSSDDERREDDDGPRAVPDGVRAECALVELALPEPHACYFHHLAAALEVPYAAVAVRAASPAESVPSEGPLASGEEGSSDAPRGCDDGADADAQSPPSELPPPPVYDARYVVADVSQATAALEAAVDWWIAVRGDDGF